MVRGRQQSFRDVVLQVLEDLVEYQQSFCPYFVIRECCKRRKNNEIRIKGLCSSICRHKNLREVTAVQIKKTHSALVLHLSWHRLFHAPPGYPSASAWRMECFSGPPLLRESAFHTRKIKSIAASRKINNKFPLLQLELPKSIKTKQRYRQNGNALFPFSRKGE